MYYNQIICKDAVEGLKELDDNIFNLTVFSPPYDNLRDYNGFNLDLHSLGEELFRTTRDGGIVVMVIQDQTLNGRKSLTSFKTIVDWCENIGFGLWENLIYKKQGKDGAWWRKRFRVDHEYMPVFIKGDRPLYFNKEPIKIPSKHGGKIMTGGANRNKDGNIINSSKMVINEKKCIGTIWDISNGGDKNNKKRLHPATFPDKIPYNFIQVFTQEGDIVCDPMVGSGSTAVVSALLNRNFIGFDISQEYCDLTKERVDLLYTNMSPDFKNIPLNGSNKIFAERKKKEEDNIKNE